MTLQLRWRIMLFTVLPLIALTTAGLTVVSRSIERQVHQNIQDDLRRASAVFENLIDARFQRLTVAGQVIVADPRFFSVLTLPGRADDPQLRATVAGVSGAFVAITHSDVFEVLDPAGELLASVGPEASAHQGRLRLVQESRGGQSVASILVGPRSHYQVTLTPVHVGERTVGYLLIGDRIGRELADELRALTRSEVTFLSGDASTGSTLDRSDDRAAVLSAVRDSGPGGAWSRDGTLFEIAAPSHTYLTLARRLPRSEPGARQVYAMQRALDTETAFLHEMRTRLAVIGSAAIVLALLAAWFVAQRITSPVQRLVTAAERMERGDYDHPLAPGGNDELGYLTARFREMRQQQRAYVQNLEQVARLKSEFISVASHELRTPISVIRGYQELIADERMGPVSAAQHQAVEAIGRAVQTLVRIAEDATRMAQIQSERLTLHVEDEDVRDLLDRAVHHVRIAAVGRHVTIRNETPASIGTARVDGLKLGQALTHLIANAVRFTPDGGHVTLCASRETGAGAIVIAIQDDGDGIADERLRHLFDPAFAISDSMSHHSSSSLEYGSHGLGLGLSIARGIVEAHSGTIEVESVIGEGTTFRLRVPARADSVRAAA